MQVQALKWSLSNCPNTQHNRQQRKKKKKKNLKSNNTQCKIDWSQCVNFITWKNRMSETHKTENRNIFFSTILFIFHRTGYIKKPTEWWYKNMYIFIENDKKMWEKKIRITKKPIPTRRAKKKLFFFRLRIKPIYIVTAIFLLNVYLKKEIIIMYVLYMIFFFM